MATQREWHFVYGKGVAQGWQYSPATGWVRVSEDDMDSWPPTSYRVVEWPQAIPTPIKDGPPRQPW